MPKDALGSISDVPVELQNWLREPTAITEKHAEFLKSLSPRQELMHLFLLKGGSYCRPAMKAAAQNAITYVDVPTKKNGFPTKKAEQVIADGMDEFHKGEYTEPAKAVVLLSQKTHQNFEAFSDEALKILRSIRLDFWKRKYKNKSQAEIEEDYGWVKHPFGKSVNHIGWGFEDDDEYMFCLAMNAHYESTENINERLAAGDRKEPFLYRAGKWHQRYAPFPAVIATWLHDVEKAASHSPELSDLMRADIAKYSGDFKNELFLIP